MDHLFDEFSKSLAESVPRRESLRRLGAVFAGAVLSPLGLGTAWAGKADPCAAFWIRSAAMQHFLINANRSFLAVCALFGLTYFPAVEADTIVPITGIGTSVTDAFAINTHVDSVT
jgi:hypothetical protein